MAAQLAEAPEILCPEGSMRAGHGRRAWWVLGTGLALGREDAHVMTFPKLL